MSTHTRSTQKTRGALRTISGTVITLFLAAFGAFFLPGVAHAADPVTLEYSADNITWGDHSEIPWSEDMLIPGGTNTTTFYVRNAADTAGTVEIYLGEYGITADMDVFVRADVNGIEGTAHTVDKTILEPGTLMNTVHLAPGESAKIALVVGMPSDASNEAQNGSFDTDWALAFVPDTTEPETPSGNGSLDFGSLSFGSLDLGSLSLGSLDLGSLSFGSDHGSADLGSSNFSSASDIAGPSVELSAS